MECTLKQHISVMPGCLHVARVAMTQYLANFPSAMNSVDHHGFRRNQPAATHKGSPSNGTHDKRRAGVPQRRTVASPLSGLVCGSNRPSRYDDIPPSVLPSVATERAIQNWSGWSFSTPNKTASDPPGSRVAARKLLANRAPRVTGASKMGRSRVSQ